MKPDSAPTVRLVEERGRKVLVLDDPRGSTTVGLALDDQDIVHRTRERGFVRSAFARAFGDRPGLHVVDATAGLGRETALLLALGHHVVAVERQPFIVELWRDALARSPRARLDFVAGDARHELPQIVARSSVDVVYLDPMFPPRSKSARVKKDLEVLQLLTEDPRGDDAELLDVALTLGVPRIVVKRPARAAVLSHPPSFALDGGQVRFDVYLNR